MSEASQSTQGRGQLNDQVNDPQLDLSSLGATLWRNKWKILRPVILIGLITLIVVEVITPKYLSESRVIVEGRDNVYLRPDADKDVIDRGTVDPEAVTSQAQLILSRDLASTVIEKLKLNKLPEFDPALNGVSRLRAVLGALGIVKNPLSMTPQERVLESYYDRLTVYPIDKSRVIVIDFLSEDQELAARIANTVADAYLELQSKVKQQQAQTAVQVLAGQVETLRKKVVDAEAKVEAYRAKSNLLVGANNNTLSAQQLSDMTAQLAAARAQKADAEAKATLIRDMLKSGQSIESFDILNSELIRRLSEQRVTLRAQLAEQLSSLLDNHPRIKELRAQIADLDHQITVEAATIARSLENDAKIAGARVDTLTTSLDQLKSQAATVNADDVQLRELERDAKSQRDLLESYLAKYREATARNTVNSPADARVISRATVSNVPAYPKKVPAVLIAMVTTLVVGCGFVLTRELLAAPGTIPAMPERPVARSKRQAAPSRLFAPLDTLRRTKSPSSDEPDQATATFGEAIRDLRDDFDNDRQCIAVIGAAPRSDTSGTALRLARALTGDKRILLVGLDKGDAAIRAASSEPSSTGLAELAAGTASFGAIITKDRQSRLHMISSGRSPTARGVILAAQSTATSFAALACSYDRVVIAAGALRGSALEAVAAIAPRAILVAGARIGAELATARQRLLDAGFEDVTVIDEAAADPEGTAAAA